MTLTNEQTYADATYSGMIDLSNGNKWGTEKAAISKMGMTTDWSSYDVLKIRYYLKVII